MSCENKKETPEIITLHTSESSTTLFPEPNVDIKTVGILLYDGFANLDAVGPYAVFTSLMGTDVFFVGLHDGLVEDARGMKVQVDTTITEVNQLDILLIPGGFKETLELTKDETLINWITRIDSSSTYTASVCTGAWILGATGLLKGKEATTHWYGKRFLEDHYGAKIVDKRYVKSDKYWTSAGVTAGMDMSLAMLRDIAGDNYTKLVMLDLEYDPKPPIIGGSETNTDKKIVETLRAMYDSGMDAVLHPEKAVRNIAVDNKKDPVCKMPISAHISATFNYNHKVYGFCSTACKMAFEKHPKRYLNTE
ncbi:hypothetical protein BKP44_14465 [Formosa algae]|nr:hypothetical protein BKP44_14465 [Formosa algae]